MNLSKPSTVAAAIASLTLAAVVHGADAPQRASCVLRFEVEPDRFGPVNQNTQALTAALTSTALVNPAMQTAIGLDADAWPKAVQLEVIPAGELAVKLSISVKSTADQPMPAGAAEKVRQELTARVLRSFNGVEKKKDDAANPLAALRAQREAIIKRISQNREEMARLSDFSAVRDNNPRVNRFAIEQQLSDLNTDLAVQQATISEIDEQLKQLKSEPQLNDAELRSKLIGQRIDARIAIAKDKARGNEFQRRLGELAAPTTAPARSAAELSAEQGDLNNARADLDRQIERLSSPTRDGTGKVRLVVVDGSAQ